MLHIQKHLICLFLAIGLLLSFSTQGQTDTITSLRHELRRLSVKDQIAPMLSLSKIYREEATLNIDSAYYYTNRALEISQSYNRFPQQIAALIELGIIKSAQDSAQSAISVFKQVLSLSKENNYEEGIILGHEQLAKTYLFNRTFRSPASRKHDYTTLKGIHHYEQAYKWIKTSDQPISEMFDLVLPLIGEYMALKIPQEQGATLLEISRHINDPSLTPTQKGAFYELSALYHRSNKIYNEAIVQYEQAIHYLSQDSTNLHDQKRIYLQMGELYREHNQPKLAIEQYQKALGVAHNKRIAIGVIHQFIGESYIMLGEYEKAKAYLNKRLDGITQNGNPFARGIAYMQLGIIGKKQNQDSLTTIYFNQASRNLKAFIKSNNYKPDNALAYSHLYQIDSFQNNLVSSLENFKMHKLYSDSIHEEKMLDYSQRLKLIRQDQEKGQELTLLSAENQIKEIEVKQSKTLQLGLIIGITLLILLLSVLYSRFRLKKKTLSMIKEKNNENKLLMKEIHHRVKNNLQIILSLLNAQREGAQQNTELQSTLLESQNKIRSMAIIHQNLYKGNNFAKVYIKSYIIELIENIQKSFEKRSRPTGFHLDIDDLEIQMGLAVPLGLILNELITNCYKYAFTDKSGPDNTITICFKSLENNKFRLEFKDNGKGFPVDFEFENSPSFGIQMIYGLVGQLNGSIKTEHKEGTTFQIDMEEPNAA